MELSKFIRQRLKIRHMNVLVALDDSLSVSRAAERLNVSQAAVSRTLAEAEAGFGLPLFERHPRGLRRTGPGQETLRAIRRILNDIAALEIVASQLGDLGRGEINIGLQTVSAVDEIAALVSAFKARHQLVRIRLRDGILPDLIEDLHNGRLDLVFGRLGADLAGKGLKTRVMSKAEVVIVTTDPGNLQADSLKDLLLHPWVLPLPGTPMRLEFDRLCEAAGCGGPADLIESNNPQLMAEIICQGGRVGVCPKPMADLWGSTMGVLNRPFPGQFSSDPIGVIFVEGKQHAPASAAFLDFHKAEWRQ